MATTISPLLLIPCSHPFLYSFSSLPTPYLLALAPGATAATAGQPCDACRCDGSHATALTLHIKKAATTEALLCMHCANKVRLNDIHLSACWSSLGQLVMQRPAGRTWLQSNVQTSDVLVQHTVRAAELGEIKARSVANMAYGAARGGRAEPLYVMFAAFARAVERRLK